VGRVKQVILIRKDLNMRRGKEVAQGAHAAMDFLAEPLRAQIEGGEELRPVLVLTEDERLWLVHGMAKVCLRVNSEAELVMHHQKALAAGIKSHLIRDSGRTEFRGQPTLTACAIGPAPEESIDLVTGDLELY
jgi:PTH2 family peptidyl-tRNA hydrolase